MGVGGRCVVGVREGSTEQEVQKRGCIVLALYVQYHGIA